MLNREELQLAAITSWVKAGKQGTIILATGSGKTHIGCTIAARQIYNKVISSVLVIVPTVNLIEQWRRVFEEFFPGTEDMVDMICVHSGHKITKAYDLIIIDEIHTALSKKRRALFSTIKHKQILGLTATIPEDEEYAKFLNSVCPVIFERSLDEVQQEDAIISDYKMYNLEISFNRSDRSKYNIFDAQFKKAQLELTVYKRTHKGIIGHLTTFDIAKEYSKIKNIGLHIGYIQDLRDYNDRYQEYAALCSDLKEIVKYSKQYWSGMTMRKWVCYESTSKLTIVTDIIKKFPDKKWILFNKSIKFAERLQKLIPNSLIYHSKMSIQAREEALEKYRTEEYKVLIAVDALNAGLDIPSANAAITISGVSTELVGVQSLGRVLRFIPGKTALFINLYTKDTVEENWTRNRTENFKNCIWINKIEAIV